MLSFSSEGARKIHVFGTSLASKAKTRQAPACTNPEAARTQAAKDAKKAAKGAASRSKNLPKLREMSARAKKLADTTEENVEIEATSESNDGLSKEFLEQFEEEWKDALRAMWSETNGGIPLAGVNKIMNSMRYV